MPQIVKFSFHQSSYCVFMIIILYCLIARKGKYWRASKNVKQIIQYPKTIHSAKPPEIRNRIVSLCGDLPRVELFARDLCDGWESIGNEINGKDIRDVIK